MTEKSVCIALDAMGGDFGPSIVVPAALEALDTYPHLKLILVGKSEEVTHYLRLHDGLSHPRLRIHPATEVVEMGEPPALALRNKRNSSMRLAINLVNQGEALACVSAGNTGALMAMARFVLKMLPGVDRPAIVYSIPSFHGHTHVLDLGANVDCKAEDLFEFAIMGSVLATAVDNDPKPRVGLLNVGSEAIKGSETVKQAAKLLSEHANELNYIGFVEGDDIFKGTVDVVVCDGFVGNVALKTTEGLAKFILTAVKEAFQRNFLTKLVGLFAFPVLKSLTKRLDPNQHNGASLLGLRGIVIKSHGKADAKAFARAIQVAMIEIEKNVSKHIQEHLAIQLKLRESSTP